MNISGDAKAFESSLDDHSFVAGGFFGQSSFSNLTRVQETSVVNVTGLIENEDDLKLFAPFGCGIQTGAGTITELAAARQEDSVTILGVGGVGLAAIMAAKLRGCRAIIGIDRVPSRLELARQLGATETINASTVRDELVKTVHNMTDGTGSTITVDTTGVVALIKQGMEFTANQGKMILLGVAPPDAALQVSLGSFMMTGKQLLGSVEGGVRPLEYIPRIIQWYREGHFPIDALVKYYKVEEFEKAVRDMEDGATVKPILLW